MRGGPNKRCLGLEEDGVAGARLRHEGHGVLCWSLPQCVLVWQFGDETRLDAYRIEGRVSALSFFESFVVEFRRKSVAHRPQQFGDLRRRLPERLEFGRVQQNWERGDLRIDIEQGPETLMALGLI